MVLTINSDHILWMITWVLTIYDIIGPFNVDWLHLLFPQLTERWKGKNVTTSCPILWAIVLIFISCVFLVCVRSILLHLSCGDWMVTEIPTTIHGEWQLLRYIPYYNSASDSIRQTSQQTVELVHWWSSDVHSCTILVYLLKHGWNLSQFHKDLVEFLVRLKM